MSSKPHTQAKKREARVETPVRPSGKPPQAEVLSRHGTQMLPREGRGFSSGEVSEAGLSRLATVWGVRVDARRRSVLQGNVSALREWGGHAAKPKREGKVRKAEEELEEVGVEIEHELKEMEKGVAKVGREAKKEAVKVEKAVRAKAKKPKAKAKKKKA